MKKSVLFNYLHNGKCIGYGGLVHINWIDKNAEVSFIMDTELEENYFEFLQAYQLEKYYTTSYLSHCPPLE